MRSKPSVESLKQIQNLVLATQIQNLAHRFRIEGKHSFNFLDSQSKQLTESSISKNLIKALPKINNEARQRSLAESKALKSLDSAIFAQQKSHKMCSTQVHTATRPLLAQSLRRHYCIFLTHFCHHDKGECRYALTRYISHLIFAAQKWRNFAIALRPRAYARTIYYIWQSLTQSFLKWEIA